MKRNLLFLFAIIMTISATGRTDGQIARTDSPRKIKEARLHRSYMPEKPKPERTHRQNLYLQRALKLKSQNDYIKQLDSIYVESLDFFSQQLIPEEKSLLAYDSKGNLKSETYFGWDEDAGEWLPKWKDEFTFNVAGFITSEIWYQWDDFEEDWVLDDLVEYNYDENGNITRITQSEWWEEDTKWVPFWKDEFEYDNGLLIEEISWVYLFTEEDWDKDWKIVYEYDGSGNLIKGTEYEWDYIDEVWIPDFQYEYSWDADGNQIHGMYSYWNDDEEIFELSYKSDYLRDGDGNLISLIYSEYDEGIFYPYQKFGYQYDANLNLTEEISYYYDEDEEEWIQEMKYEYIIDTSYSSDEILKPFYWDYFFESYKNMITAIVISSGTEDELTVEQKITLYHNDYKPDVINSAIVIEPTRPGIYPNPFQDNITLSNVGNIRIVRIINLAGQTLREFYLTGSDTQTLSAGDLDAGIYLFIMQTDKGELITRKLIKN